MVTPIFDGHAALRSPMSFPRSLSLNGAAPTCPVCWGAFQDPRVLQCNHVFCRRCLVSVLAQRTIDPESHALQGNDLVCPECRKITSLTQRGVDALPINFRYVNQDIDLFDDDLDPLGVNMAPIPTTPMSATTFSLSSASPSTLHYCPEHQKELDFFCPECDQLMCASCAVRRLCGHNEIVEAKEALQRLRARCYDPLEIRSLKTSEAVDEVTRMLDAIRKNNESNKQRIRIMFQELRDELNGREHMLVQATEGIMNKKILALQVQLESLQELQKELRAKKDMVSARLTLHGGDFRMLHDRKELMDEVKQIVAMADRQDRKPVESIKDGPECHLPDALLKEAHTYGEIFCSPHPARFVASGAGLSKAFVGAEAKFIVEAYDKYGQRAFKSGSAVEVKVQGPTGLEVVTSVTDQGRGGYLVHYIPQVVGMHSVTITVEKKSISNWRSAVTVFGRRDYSAITKPRATFSRQHFHSDVCTVRSVCCLGNRQIAFADAFKVRMISSEGKQVKPAIGSYGSGQGQFNTITGITVSNQGHLYVTDTQNHRMQKMTLEGKPLATFGGYGNRAGNLHYPEDVALADGRVFVADGGNNRVAVFQQKTGKCVNLIGGKVTERGLQMKCPQGVATDESLKRLFVADTENSRVLGLSLEGKPLTDFGQNSEVLLAAPTAIAVDNDGFILVASSRTHVITILTPQGVEIKQLGVEGALFRKLSGICVDDRGNIVVADAATASIHIF